MNHKKWDPFKGVHFVVDFMKHGLIIMFLLVVFHLLVAAWFFLCVEYVVSFRHLFWAVPFTGIVTFVLVNWMWVALRVIDHFRNAWYPLKVKP